MHSKNDKKEFMICDNAVEVIEHMNLLSNFLILS